MDGAISETILKIDCSYIEEQSISFMNSLYFVLFHS